MTAEPIVIRIVTEEVTGTDEVPRWKGGYEVEGGYGSTGWWGNTAEETLLRCLNDELDGMDRALERFRMQAAAIRALAVEIEFRHGIDLALPDLKPTYETARMWGSTRYDALMTDRNGWMERLSNAHRCPHGRICLDDCHSCMGFSVGGPACAFDDMNFWKDFENGVRRG